MMTKLRITFQLQALGFMAAMTAVTFLTGASSAMAEEPRIEKTSPQDGVFVTYGGHNIVLELKGSKFRYWFSSDRLSPDAPAYPLEGTFTAADDKVVLKHDKFIPLESNWTFRMIDGVVTLWRSDAMELSSKVGKKFELYSLGKSNFFRIGGGSILVPTTKTAEHAWKSPQTASLSEDEHKLKDEWVQNATSPQVSATTNALDAAQVLAIARAAVATNDTWLDRAEFEPPKQQTNGTWSVIVWRLPKQPGGHRIVSIDATGKVTGYLRGR
jgi:hypothetical protein